MKGLFFWSTDLREKEVDLFSLGILLKLLLGEKAVEERWFPRLTPSALLV